MVSQSNHGGQRFECERNVKATPEFYTVEVQFNARKQMPNSGAIQGRSCNGETVQIDGNFVVRTHALRFVVRDMGNGVDRLEHASLVPLEDARAEAKLQDREPLIHPYPDRFFDIRVAAAKMLGIKPVDINKFVVGGCVRAIDDRTTEILSYAKEHF